MASVTTIELAVGEDKHWTSHIVTQHVDIEKLAEELAKSKIKKELKEDILVLIKILECNEKIIHYRTSINYFLEKLIPECPNCNKYCFRIESAIPKEGNHDYYTTKLICEQCLRHSVDIIVPYKLIVSYCHFYQIPPPIHGQEFQDHFARRV